MIVLFTIEAQAEGKGVEPSSQLGNALARRPGKPYPATFRNQARGERPETRGFVFCGLSPVVSWLFQVDRRGVEPRFPGCRPGVVPLDQQPLLFVVQRSARESNPVFLLTEEVCRAKHLQTDSHSDPGWNRTITFLVVTQASSPLDHGIVFE